MVDTAEMFDKILQIISNEQVSLYKIVYYTKINARTVKKYLRIIEKIQSSPKVLKETKGARVFFRKE